MNKKLWMFFEKESPQKPSLETIAKKEGINFQSFFADCITFDGDTMLYENKPIDTANLPDLLLLRSGLGHEQQIHAYFAKHGIRVIDNAITHHNCDDKKNMHTLMEQNGILQPKTLFFDNAPTYEQLSKELGSTFVAKDRFGQ